MVCLICSSNLCSPLLLFFSLLRLLKVVHNKSFIFSLLYFLLSFLRLCLLNIYNSFFVLFRLIFIIYICKSSVLCCFNKLIVCVCLNLVLTGIFHRVLLSLCWECLCWRHYLWHTEFYHLPKFIFLIVWFEKSTIKLYSEVRLRLIWSKIHTLTSWTKG